jgi:EmrB/QacA subfamily drug resistance transporter
MIAPPDADDAAEAAGEAPVPVHLDPRRWITLGIIVTAVLIAALDSTVLNVAIPTILRDFHTTLPSLQWVITGYSLTFAALLIIGGRLGDIFGARTMFIIGAFLFGIGSLLASLSTGVPTLVLGEAIIEGIGASLMLPATLGILSSTFVGRERATAFAVWGATMGAAVAFGPLLGGFLTTNYSWRWAFRINVIIVPFAIAGAVLFMKKVPISGRRQRIDVPGAALIATGMFMLVFGISEGGTYGWLKPVAPFTLGGSDLWPASRPISLVPIAFLVALALLVGFYRVERAKEQASSDPLFEFSELRHPGFRYGLMTLLLLAMGQIAFLFVLSVFLQNARHLSAVDTGLWLVPSGLFIVAGSQLGSRLTRSIGTTNVVRIGLALEAIGLTDIAFAIHPTLTLVGLLPGFATFGVGIGFAGSQLTNVILSDIPPEKSGAASGANSTVRMIGAALGISIISALFTVETVRHGVANMKRAASLGAAARARAIAQIHAVGVNYQPTSGPAADIATLQHEFTRAVASGARAPLFYAAAVVTFGALMSFRIPQIDGEGRGPQAAPPVDEDLVEARREAEMMAEAVTVQ